MQILQFTLIVTVISLLISCPSAFSNKVTPYNRLQFRQTIRQAYDYSCGAAVVATLLNYYYKITTTEDDILALARQLRPPSELEKRGMRSSDLVDVLAFYEIKASIKQPEYKALQSYLKANLAPIILFLGNSGKVEGGHFVLAVAVVNDDWLILADPTTGLKVIPLASLNSFGYAMGGLVIVPDLKDKPELMAKARNQQKILRKWATLRIQKLQFRN